MQENTKILLLSTNDVGGAGNAFLKTTEMLRAKGIDATLLVCNKKSDSEASVGVFDAHTRLGRIRITINRCYCKLRKMLAFGKTEEKYIMFDLQINMVSAKRVLALYGKRPDVIRVGWVTDFVSAKTIKELQELTGAKVNYVMTDNAPIGGGCHYPWDCQGYTKDCFPCPALSASNTRARKTLLFKKRYVTPEMFISGSVNDISRAKKSLVFSNSKQLIGTTMTPNPYAFSRQKGREYFGITDEKYVLFCGAEDITTERKGFKELIESLVVVKQKTDISNIVIVVAGGGKGEFPLGYEVKKVGKLSFEDLFRAYACADLFLCPSLEDSGPIMLKYGVMAYIPVVTFEVGCAIDVIRHKENGYIAQWRDVEDFASGIMYCISNREKLQADIRSVTESVVNKCNSRPSVWDCLGVEIL